MDGFIVILVEYFVEIIGTLILLGLGIFTSWVLNKLGQNKKLQNITEATAQLLDAVRITVISLQQQFVEDWKKNQNGKLTEEQIIELKQKVITITLNHLGQPTMDLLNAAKIDIINLITNAAEAYVLELKNQK